MLDQIQSLASQCSFVSEENHEVNAFIAGRNQSSLTAGSFKSLMPHLQNQSVTAESFDDVISNQENNSSAWSQLRAYLENNLSNVVLLKSGTTRREVFAVGLSNGNVIGVSSFAVET